MCIDVIVCYIIDVFLRHGVVKKQLYMRMVSNIIQPAIYGLKFTAE